MTVTLPVDVGDEERVLLVPRARGRVRGASAPSPRSPSACGCPAAARAVTLTRPPPRRRRRRPHRCRGQAARRGRGAARPGRRPRTAASASSSASTAPSSRRSSSCAATTGASRPSSARSPSPARSPTRPATRPTVTFEQKVELLETVDVRERLELALALQRERLAELQVRQRIREDVESGAQKQQREYILRRQMDSIRKELGEDDASVVDEYRTKIAEAGMPDDRARAGRARARPARADGRAVGRVVDDPRRTSTG